MGLPSLRLYYAAMVLPTTSGKSFLCFANKCKQVYSLLPTTIGKDFLLWIVAWLQSIAEWGENAPT